MSEAIVSNSACSGNSRVLPGYPATSAAVAYPFLRHIGYILDELCAQGLILWLDDNNRWQWCWQGTELKSTRGFWAMGEALVDAVNGRYPETFSMPNPLDEFE